MGILGRENLYVVARDKEHVYVQKKIPRQHGCIIFDHQPQVSAGSTRSNFIFV